MCETTRRWVVVAGLVVAAAGVGTAATVGATEQDTIFERLVFLDGIEARHGALAENLRGRVRDADEELGSRWTDVDVALRAAKPIRYHVSHSLVTWLGAHRAASRVTSGPGAPEDTRTLLRHAARRALPSQLRDVDVIHRADEERATFAALVHRRGRATVDLALSQATGDVAAHGRRRLVETAREGGADTDLEATEEELTRRLAVIARQGVSFDFHRLKGTLARPVTMEPAHTFGSKGPLVRPNGLTYRPEEGREVYATGAGRVVFVETVQGWGRVVVIDHGGGYRSIYGHLSNIRVDVDDEVQRADVIAAAGESGSLDGVRTYYELRRDGDPVDPLPWFLKK